MAEYKEHVASTPLIEIDDAALQLFLALARDTAPAEERAFAERETAASLSQIKRAGLVATVNADGRLISHFTGAGRHLALKRGIAICAA